MLTEALNMTQHFLDEFNIIQTKSMFPVSIATFLYVVIIDRGNTYAVACLNYFFKIIEIKVY